MPSVSAAGWPIAPGPATAGLRIGLLGGSFNPAHEGHLYISEVAMKRLPLDYVWWLISPGNPLKDPAGQAPFEARLSRARQMASHPRIAVSDLERRLGTVYTVDTLKALKVRFAGVRFVWLMGSDNLEQFDRWQDWTGIVAQVSIAVVIRPGSEMAPLKAKAMQRYWRYRRRFLHAPVSFAVLDGHRNEQSATRLRALGAWDEAVIR